MWKTERVAKRPASPADLREAVERTVQATMGSAERQRERTQGALDDLAGSVDQLRKGAEAGIARGRKAVAGAIESGRPATYEDMRELKAELRRIGRRLDAIEERLPAKRAPAPARPSAPARRRSAAPRRSARPPGAHHRCRQPPGRSAGRAARGRSGRGGDLRARHPAPAGDARAHRTDRRRHPRPGHRAAPDRLRRRRSWCTTGSSASPAQACRRARCTTST